MFDKMLLNVRLMGFVACLFVCFSEIIHHWFVWLGLVMCTLIRYLRFLGTVVILIFTPKLDV